MLLRQVPVEKLTGLQEACGRKSRPQILKGSDPFFYQMLPDERLAAPYAILVADKIRTFYQIGKPSADL